MGIGLNALARLTGFEEGGEPPINQPAIVGEGGPEICVPKTSGFFSQTLASWETAGTIS